jgi:hypothetical protein
MSVSKETAAHMNAVLREEISLEGELHKALASLAIQPCARSLYPIPPMTPAETAQADAAFFDVNTQPEGEAK